MQVRCFDEKSYLLARFVRERSSLLLTLDGERRKLSTSTLTDKLGRGKWDMLKL